MEKPLLTTFFSILGVVCFATLSLTLWRQPLFPLQTTNLEWLQSWLWMTVLDYYGACLPFCAVIIANESSLQGGILWSTACLLLGSPFCCLWLVLRLWSSDTRYPAYRWP